MLVSFSTIIFCVLFIILLLFLFINTSLLVIFIKFFALQFIFILFLNFFLFSHFTVILIIRFAFLFLIIFRFLINLFRYIQFISQKLKNYFLIRYMFQPHLSSVVYQYLNIIFSFYHFSDHLYHL